MKSTQNNRLSVIKYIKEKRVNNYYKQNYIDEFLSGKKEKWEKLREEILKGKKHYKIEQHGDVTIALYNGLNDNDIREIIFGKEEKIEELILWHGSVNGIKFPIKVDYSKNLTDFGQAFYLGEKKEQAINRVCEQKKPVLYKFRLLIDNKCKVYRFTDDVMWALFIAYNRKKKIDFAKYPKLKKEMEKIAKSDMIIGNIADDKIAFSYNNFIDGLTTSKVLIESLKLIKYGKQCVIKNSKYVKKEFLQIKEQIKLTNIEKEKAKKWGKNIKEKMDKQLEEIQNKYRRDGKFIDELLKEYG